MLTRKKQSENVDPLQLQRGVRAKRPDPVAVKAGPSKVGPAKLKKVVPGQRRAAFGDITNANKDKVQDGKHIPIAIKPGGKPLLAGKVDPKLSKLPGKKREPAKKAKALHEATALKTKQEITSSQESTCSTSEESLLSSQEESKARCKEERVEEDFSFIEGGEEEEETEPLLAIDKENYSDVFNVGVYAQGIFDYYKRRELMFKLPPFLQQDGCRISASMRAILVDWLVDIQENFELNHETLYLAVKLCDTYLSRVKADKEYLQLIGAASIFISSKFDERCPPLIEDFTYVCDNAFTREEFLEMEMEILRTVDFDLGIPISYRFLRRYAKVAQMSMETLTLARFILEMSLMQHEFIPERDSMMAAAALFIAMKMKKEGAWEGDVVKSCGYSKQDLLRLIVQLNAMLRANPVAQLSAIRGKYSHIVFHEVAKIRPLPTTELLS